MRRMAGLSASIGTRMLSDKCFPTARLLFLLKLTPFLVLSSFRVSSSENGCRKDRSCNHYTSSCVSPPYKLNRPNFFKYQRPIFPQAVIFRWLGHQKNPADIQEPFLQRKKCRPGKCIFFSVFSVYHDTGDDKRPGKHLHNRISLPGLSDLYNSSGHIHPVYFLPLSEFHIMILFRYCSLGYMRCYLIIFLRIPAFF